MATRIYTEGFDKLNKKLFRAQARAKNPSTYVGAATIKGWREVVRHFNNEEGPKGKWKKLKASTLAQRRGGEGGILKDTGRLRNSIRWRVSGSNVGIIFTNLIYAATQNFGRGKIPSRKFMWLPKDYMKKAAKGLLKFVAGAF